ncbi:myocyte-specific enhancer factor 2C-like isoform X2 [Styela clava]|uniref:myocyte-specific enhancer factor 2C-like isoform X2 n=1 Tax=Styela clava TaxID=7725 RepID=UPI001939F217|nr:myocyte-specific enhancer factor 2C-like isoform X2 [Styela clava]
MGRKKIQISRIGDERNRQVTFTKRKFGLMKKAYELSVLCDCEIALIIFNSSNKLFQYASTDMDKVLLKYTEYNEPHESRTNADIIEMLNKKENKNCDSPDPESTGYMLTPNTLKRYETINQEFDDMMKSVRPQQTIPSHHIHGAGGDFIPMPVTVPVSSQVGLGGNYGHMHHLIQHPDPNLLHPPHPHHGRHSTSPLPRSPLASPSRSPSGGMYGSDMSVMSDASSPGPNNGYSSIQRTSPSIVHMDRTSPMPQKQIGSIPKQQQSPRQPSPTRKTGPLHLSIPASRSGMEGIDNQQLSTPIVSLATPSVQPGNMYQHTYNPNEYMIHGGEGFAGFSTPNLLANMQQHWPHHHSAIAVTSSQLQHPSRIEDPNMSGMHHGSGNVHSFNIKREPASPPDKGNPEVGMRRPPPNRSPMEIMGSYGVADDGGGMMLENGETSQKRQRLDPNPGQGTAEWAT